MSYQPKTGDKCHCKRGIQRDNCPACEGTGWLIDFAAIRARHSRNARPMEDSEPTGSGEPPVQEVAP